VKKSMITANLALLEAPSSRELLGSMLAFTGPGRYLIVNDWLFFNLSSKTIRKLSNVFVIDTSTKPLRPVGCVCTCVYGYRWCSHCCFSLSLFIISIHNMRCRLESLDWSEGKWSRNDRRRES